MLACTKVSARELSQQFRTHAIEKTYLALVHAESRQFPAKKGLISDSLNSENGRVRLGAEKEPGGKPALTTWEVLAFSVRSLSQVSKSLNTIANAGIVVKDKAPVALVRLNPRTGLKHQLRVHMARSLQGMYVTVRPSLKL